MHVVMLPQSITGGTYFLAYLTVVRHIQVAFKVSFHVPLFRHNFTTGVAAKLGNPTSPDF